MTDEQVHHRIKAQRLVAGRGSVEFVRLSS